MNNENSLGRVQNFGYQMADADNLITQFAPLLNTPGTEITCTRQKGITAHPYFSFSPMRGGIIIQHVKMETITIRIPK